MTKRQIRTTVTDKDGSPITEAPAYKPVALLPDGIYMAVVNRLNPSKGAFKNGKNFVKYTPEFVIGDTRITRQDFIFGTVDKDGNLYSDTGSNLIWSTARFLLSAMGLLKFEDGQAVMDFEDSKLFGVVIKVLVRTETYTKQSGESGSKNVIKGTYALTERECVEGEYFPRDGMVFLSEDDYEAYAMQQALDPEGGWE